MNEHDTDSVAHARSGPRQKLYRPVGPLARNVPATADGTALSPSTLSTSVVVRLPPCLPLTHAVPARGTAQCVQQTTAHDR